MLTCNCGRMLISIDGRWQCPQAGNKFIHPRGHTGREISDRIFLLSEHGTDMADQRIGVQHG